MVKNEKGLWVKVKVDDAAGAGRGRGRGMYGAVRAPRLSPSLRGLRWCMSCSGVGGLVQVSQPWGAQGLVTWRLGGCRTMTPTTRTTTAAVAAMSETDPPPTAAPPVAGPPLAPPLETGRGSARPARPAPARRPGRGGSGTRAVDRGPGAETGGGLARLHDTGALAAAVAVADLLGADESGAGRGTAGRGRGRGRGAGTAIETTTAAAPRLTGTAGRGLHPRGTPGHRRPSRRRRRRRARRRSWYSPPRR